MATITAAITAATSSTNQNLFSISQTDGVTSYGTIGDASVVTLDTVYVQVGTDVNYNTGRNEWTLVGPDITYTLSASVSAINVDPGTTYGWYVTGGNLIGTTAIVGQPLTVSYTNAAIGDATVTLIITNANGEAFQYPAQVVNASATVTEVSGYTVA